MYPRSFADANGDGIGDLLGITSRLQHLAHLGVDAVWLPPFYRSPQVDGGYDVADYRAVDDMFGTLSDFDALLQRAHELGLRVITQKSMSSPTPRSGCFSTPTRADMLRVIRSIELGGTHGKRLTRWHP